MIDLDERKQKAIQITGSEPQAAVRLQLEQLRTEGILVDLNITGTGIFTKSTNWLELGIPDWVGDKRTTQFTKGTKYLYPEEKVAKIKSFESRLRQNLDKHSFDVTGFRPFRWLPYTAYQAWRSKHDEIVNQANAYIQIELLDCHDQCLEYVAESFAKIAGAAWLSATGGENEKGRRTQAYKYIQIKDKAKGNIVLDRAQFVQYIVDQAVALVPSVVDIMNKLRFDYTTALVYGQEDIAADEAKAQNIRANVYFEREKAQIKLDALREKTRKKAWDNQLQQRTKEEMLEAMRQAEYDHHREQLRETVSPFVEVYRQAIGQFINHAKDMLESIQKNKHVRGKVAERGRGLLDIYNLLVLPGMGDDRMMDYLKDLRALLGPADETRNTEAITAKLQDIIALEKEIAADMLTIPTTFSYLEV
jgi:hypothetical protein